MRIPIALLGLTAVGSLCTPAFAGHWEQHYECDGKDVVVRSSDSEITEYPWTTNISSTFSRQQEIGPPAYIGNKVQLSGKVRAVFTWTKDSPEDVAPPPPVLAVKESAESLARCYYRWYEEDDSEGEEYLTGTIADGFGDPVDPLAQKSKGIHIQSFEVPTNGVLKLPWRELEATAQMPDVRLTLSPGAADGAQDSAHVTCNLYYKAEPDTRTVKITRDGAPTAKSESDPTLDKAKDEWIEKDGTGHGHSRYSYNHWEIYLDVPVKRSVYNWEKFAANRSGGWSSNLSYDWTPPATGVTDLDNHEFDVEFGSPEGNIVGEWQGDPTAPNTKIVTYTVTDNTLGGTARARYLLTLHDEGEVSEPFYDEPEEIVETWHPFPSWTSNPVYPDTTPADITNKYGVTYNSSISQEITKTKDVGMKLSVDAGVDVAKFVPWMQAKGLSDSVTGSAYIAVATKEVAEQKNNEQLTYSIMPAVTVHPGDRAIPAVKIHAHRKKYHLRTFDDHGLVDDKILTVDVYSDAPFEPMWDYDEGGASNPNNVP